MKYNWQHPNWQNFLFNDTVIDSLCMEFALETGELKGLVDSLSSEIQQETILQFMISEAIKTSEIEGEFFSRQDVMSSIKKNLGIGDSLGQIKDKSAQGIGKLMVTVRNSYAEKLTEFSIKEWHAILMKYSKRINPGEYRIGEESMQIVSGSYDKEIIHFEAPPSNQVPLEMKNFIKWYTNFEVKPTDIKSALVKTSISHLYFESIHPFEDGNGRIGRAIAEKCLSESLNRPVLMSISSTIEKDKKQYYESLKLAQRAIEITDWILYFSKLILDSQKNAKQTVLFTLNKTKFIDKFKNQMNDRQNKAVLKMFENGIFGFEGGMTAIKYVSINKTSRATATRDLQDLTEKSILTPRGEGRNRSYDLNLMS
ncbi:Fic family protein [Flavobacterium franklandianum]|uniref:Fic family protein n=1 Tax=Flavobacterium franklandianum TaxID=2594430 RepID=UPI00117A6EDB|nr:Fic family protein [Flavobacterium franklandianum]TRX27994.1 Fic family protein [Flavobacterium franklandianum]